MIDFSSLLSPGAIADPYPIYEALLRSGEPVWQSPEKEIHSQGIWMFVRHADAVQVLSLSKGVTKQVAAARPPGMGALYDQFMLVRDNADHLRLRRAVSTFLTPSRLQGLQTVVATLVDRLLDDLSRQAVNDLMPCFAEALPLLVTSHLIGAPSQDMSSLRAWSLAITTGMDVTHVDSQPAQHARREGMVAFTEYGKELIAIRRNSPGDDLTSHLIQCSDRGELSDGELLSAVIFMLIASHETTVNLLGNGLYLLLTHPSEAHRLREQPELAASAIEEIMRYETPIQRLTFRMATEPLTIGGHRVAPGEQLNVLLGAANRDPAVFVDPDRFDIARNPNPHLGFGMGLHHCIGKSLARMEGRIALPRLLRRFPGMGLAAGGAKWRGNTFFRGLKRLEVKLA